MRFAATSSQLRQMYKYNAENCSGEEKLAIHVFKRNTKKIDSFVTLRFRLYKSTKLLSKTKPYHQIS